MIDIQNLKIICVFFYVSITQFSVTKSYLIFCLEDAWKSLDFTSESHLGEKAGNPGSKQNPTENFRCMTNIYQGTSLYKETKTRYYENLTGIALKS